MSAKAHVPTPARLAAVALVALVALAIAACSGGGSKSSTSPTPSGSASTSNAPVPTGPANALLVIGSPDATKAVLADATSLALVKNYLLTSLSMDPASFAGITFASDDTVWGAEPAAPQADSQAFLDAYNGAYGAPPAGVPVAAAYDSVYLIALAAVAANSSVGSAIRDNIDFVANSPGDVAKYGGDAFATATQTLAAGGEINYIGASGQVDLDANGEASKGGAQTWKVINGQIAPIETRDVDLAAESGDSVPAGELKTSTTPATAPLVIGILVTDDDAGVALGNAAQLAVDQINGAGDVLGQSVQLVKQTITGASDAGAAATSLTDSGAGAIIGPVAADAVSAALDVAKAKSVPLLALSSATELSALDGGGFLFRIVPSDALQMPVLANLALEEHADNICVLYADGTVGKTMADAFQKAMQFKKANVRSSQAFDPAVGDYKSLLQTCIGG